MAEIIEINNLEELEKFDTDILNSLQIVCEFWDVYSCAIVKNGIPVGVALAPTGFEAKIKALDCNPIEAIGATIAFSKKIDNEITKSISKMGFKKLVVPNTSDEILKNLSKIDIKIYKINFDLKEYKKFLLENSEEALTPKTFKVATKLKPTQEQIEDMVFARKVLKTIKQDAVIVAKDFKTRAIELGKGVKVIEQALDNACDGSKEAILAISKNITDQKELNPAIQGRINGIIEPKNETGADKEIIKTAEKYEIVVVTTGNKEE